MEARKFLVDNHHIASENEFDILDCPYLTGPPGGLKEILPRYEGVIFADVCKEGPGTSVLSTFIPTLHDADLLPRWTHVGACRTYNPLGSTETFLNVQDVVGAYYKLLSSTRTTEVA